MERIDLHTHSTYSDGTLTPTQLIALASERKIKAIAISDHDTIEALPEGREAAAKYNIEFINAIELSSYIDKHEVHILAYFFHNNLENLNSELKDVKLQRENRNKEMLKKFNEKGIELTYDELLKTSGGNIISRAHFAKLLLEKNYVESINAAFLKYLSHDSSDSVYVGREKLSPEKTIALIKSSNGVPVLAHPTRYGLDKRSIESMVARLKDIGLEGIEAYYSSYDKKEELFIIKLAKKYNLKLSGGSDFHGSIKPHINLGDGTDKTIIPYTILDLLRK